ncbi:unnamed protein product [Aphanomyces euteiches]
MRIITDTKGTELVAVYGGRSATAKNLAEEVGCDYEDDLETICSREDVDVVIVASPNHAHKEPVLLAAKYGKHVFCEKPIALTLADCKEMVEACQQANVIFMAGHILHFMSGIKRVKRLIAEGVIGTPIVAHGERTGWEQKQQTVSWKKNKASSGGHLFHHIHEMDIIQSIMGPAQRVSMTGGNLAHQGEGFGDEEDVLMLSMEFENGTLGTMQYGSGFHWGEHYVKINGTLGSLYIDFKNSKILVKANNQTTEYDMHDLPEENIERQNQYKHLDGGIVYGNADVRPPLFIRNMMIEEMELLRDVIGGAPIPEEWKILLDGTAALHSVATAETAERALQQKSWMSV